MEDDQQFCLRWNNHQATLISVFDKLLEKGIHVDCTLAAEGQTLKAHKVVLSACSPYFESVLSQQYDKHPIIILKDVKYAELKAMMDYMYRGEVNISQDQLAALLKAAESLQIKGLSDNKPSPPPPQTISPPKQLQCESLSGETEDEEESLSCASSSVSGRKRLKRSDSPNILMPNENNNLPPAASSPIPTLTPSAPHNGRHDTDDPPSTSAINDVVQNFQWHMERNAQEEFNQDGQRDSQELSADKSASAEPKTSPDLNLRPRTRALNQSELKINDERKERNISSALLSLLRAQHRAPPALLQPQAKEFAAYTVLASNVPIVAKMEDFVDAAFRNNNKLDDTSDVKFESGDDGSSEAEFDDTDDIVLPDDADSQYGHSEMNSVYEGGRTHSGSSGDDTSRPFECRHCGKRYRWKSTLRRHENVECGGKAPSHQCPYCDYKAKQRGNLGVHIRKHHNKEWYVYATNRVRKSKKESVA